MTNQPTTRPAAVPPDWEGLRSRLGGGLHRIGQDGYDTARRSYNPLFDKQAPAAVATCSKTEHVQACVSLARDARLPVAARSGGHSYTGYSAPDGGLVVDLGGMSAVDVRADGTAVVGAGARLIEVYAALAAAGRALPAGSCPTVGIGGLTLGGGIGVLTRKYGLTCDNLVSAEVVTAEGTIRTASESSEPDLFWALRGGGGGNFGIVTSFTFATVPAPSLAVFQLTYPEGSVADVVGAWQEWTASAPDELWSNVVITGGAATKCRVNGCFVGPQSGLNPLLDRLVARAGKPSGRSVSQRAYLDAMRYFAGCANRSIAQCGPESLPRETFVASSRVLPTAVADPNALADLLVGRTDMDLLLDSLGGAVSRVDPTATPFPHRKALATAQIYQKTTVDKQPEAARAVAEVRDALARLGARGGYVNYIEAAMPDWGLAYYGSNINRLNSVARRYDPDQVFTFAQSIHRA
ncbi:FAD-binding oxidoreductase [Actinokineospora sp. NBRC 105648]|uniref:FAD-binding oxidoreductase n=1 Tax=Actinokineospora sp. NBRC 105648 TaxID=3032206 RepID=UPI0024A5DE34|nr:FAD-binding oxidoreductase [Actinokineospora sp. NBRC 105648]GLZ42101.1 FAD-binding dehydrogenase [Actinokineospora sp. NBRC 105648]